MNPELYDKKYPVPLPIIEKLKAKLMTTDGSEEDGVKRAKFLIHNGYATYQMMKKIKNFFDNFDELSDSIQEYELSGGKEMHDYIDHTLDADRGVIATSKRIKDTVNPDLNRNIKAVSEEVRKDGLINNIAYPKPRRRIPEGEDGYVDGDNGDNGDSGDSGDEAPKEELTKNALAVIHNDKNKILLLKRSSYPDQWMPNKWGLVGGGVEEGEEPIDGCQREIFEETGLEIKNLVERAALQRNPDSVEHIFLAKYNGNPYDVNIDKENQAYGWFGENEVENLDIVPNLMDYINIAIKKYD